VEGEGWTMRMAVYHRIRANPCAKVNLGLPQPLPGTFKQGRPVQTRQFA